MQITFGKSDAKAVHPLVAVVKDANMGRREYFEFTAVVGSKTYLAPVADTGALISAQIAWDFESLLFRTLKFFQAYPLWATGGLVVKE